ncbi:MAG: NADH-quinone oxidoreductase subunit M [Gammaproteobacteria bacterium]|nr:NADH-quinone oxidoreductase subunit M [Gammaproteobacteria bacterium]
MSLDTLPLLSLIIFSPLIAGLLIWLIPGRKQAPWLAMVGSGLPLLFSLIVMQGFDQTSAAFQYVEQMAWIPTINAQYLLGVDGISLLFLPLTALLFLGVIALSWRTVQTQLRFYLGMLLILESAIFGVFTALDGILFFLFWELTLIPLYFLISLWGIGPNRRFAASKYTLLMLVGGVPMLFGFILLAFNATPDAGLVFDYRVWLENPLVGGSGVALFFLLLFGFGFKTPLFPFHTWLPLVAQEGSPAVVALLVGLKLGVYGLIRFLVPLAPEAALDFNWLLAGLGVIGVIYGALVAMAQTNLRRMLAFSSISHVGLVLLGLSTYSYQGLQGAVFQMLNFTLIASSLFLLAGFLRQRVGSTDYVSLGGVARSMPLLASLFFLFGLAAMGIPGTSGFPAELLILISAIQRYTGAGLAALFGVVLGAVYFMAIFRRAFLGPAISSDVLNAPDLRPGERWVLLLMLLLVLVAGFYPEIVLQWLHASSRAWVAALPG